MNSTKFIAQTFIYLFLAFSPTNANSQLLDLVNKLGQAVNNLEKSISSNNKIEESNLKNAGDSNDSEILNDADIFKSFHIKGYGIGTSPTDEASIKADVESSIRREAQAVCIRLSEDAPTCTKEMLSKREWIDEPNIQKAIVSRISEKFRRSCKFTSLYIPIYECGEKISILERDAWLNTTYLKYRSASRRILIPNLNLSREYFDQVSELIKSRAGEKYLPSWQSDSAPLGEFPFIEQWKSAVQKQKASFSACEDSMRQAAGDLGRKNSRNENERRMVELVAKDSRTFRGSCGDFGQHGQTLIQLIEKSERSCGKCSTIVETLGLQDKNSVIFLKGLLINNGTLPLELTAYLYSKNYLDMQKNQEQYKQTLTDFFNIEINYGNFELLKKYENEAELIKTKAIELSKNRQKLQEDRALKRQLKDF